MSYYGEEYGDEYMDDVVYSGGEEYGEEYGDYGGEEFDYGDEKDGEDGVEEKVEYREREQGEEEYGEGKATFADIGRVGISKPSQYLQGTIVGSKKLQKIQEKIEIMSESYSQRLEKSLEEYGKKYEIENVIKSIINSYKKIPNNTFLNPLLLILGFLNLRDDRTNKDIMNRILKDEKNIKPIHVARYSIIWSKYM